jgi:hypothetical protein
MKQSKDHSTMMAFVRNYSALIVFSLLQLAYWHRTSTILPDMSVVPEVPGRQAVAALSFGDEEFYFRVLALEIQNAGDTFGRFTELYKYDFSKLYAWFTLLDTLDSDSNYIPFLASYYFSQTQHTQDVRYVVDYLYEHSKDRPGKDYWWLAQASYLAEHKLKDRDLALKMALPLERATNAPFWVRQLPAFVHERRGEMDDAYAIIENIEKNTKNIPPSELRFMTYFVQERLKKLDTMEKKKATEPSPSTSTTVKPATASGAVQKKEP